ncbi:MAG: ribosomal protein S18 acetylase RimI-like enzyme [Yoonia sp.]|jgi:ribosomal protein S18 acetylase RimI-like enzyme
MTLPTVHTLYDVIDHTWPAAKIWTDGPFTLRRGGSGGSRVSAATLNGTTTDLDIVLAEQTMQDMSQPSLFMLKDGQDNFDAQLEAAGYIIKDPVNLYAAPIATLTQDRPPHKTCFSAWPPLAAQTEVWATGGIGPERLAIMDRALGPKSSFLGRTNDQPAGTVFAAIHGGIAMLHALEIDPEFRRQGLGRHLTRAVAVWAQSQGTSHLSLMTTEANTGANALYASLGMTVVGHYHYRIKISE